MATGTIYNRDVWSDIQANMVQPYAIGIKGSADPNCTTAFDFTLADDVFLRAIETVITGAHMGDTISISVIDVNGVTGYPPGTVVATPVQNWNVPDGSTSVGYTSVTPRKALATMKVRVSYTNTSLLGSVNVGVNFNFLKILS